MSPARVSVPACLAAAIMVAASGCKPPVASNRPAPVAAGGTSTVAVPERAEPDPVPDVSLAEIGLTEDGWYQSWEQAAAKAQETGRPIMVDFTGSDWCGWCIKLDEEVFSKDEFKSWADKKVVLLKLDFPRKTQLPASLKKQNDELKEKYGVRGFPTILFLSATGEKIADYGYESGGPENWTAKADEKIGG